MSIIILINKIHKNAKIEIFAIKLDCVIHVFDYYTSACAG